nr:unnamed protein product [Digitaria exilis]
MGKKIGLCPTRALLGSDRVGFFRAGRVRLFGSPPPQRRSRCAVDSVRNTQRQPALPFLRALNAFSRGVGFFHLPSFLLISFLPFLLVKPNQTTPRLSSPLAGIPTPRP